MNSHNPFFSSRASSEFKPVKIKRSIRFKILFVVIPILLIAFGFLGLTFYFSTNNGITKIAKEFLGYKLEEIFQFSQGQETQIEFLKQSGASLDIDLKNNILEYTKKFNEEKFILIPFSGDFQNTAPKDWSMSTNFQIVDLENLFSQLQNLEQLAQQDPSKRNSWISFHTTEHQKFVGIFIPNYTLKYWFVLVTPLDYFYSPVKQVVFYLILILSISVVLMSILLLWFVNILTEPLKESVDTIHTITQTMDFSKRIRIRYKDEIGYLGQYFNTMISELEKSYNQIKNYAYQTVLAKRREERIRFIFQKYVPSDIIDYVLNQASDTVLIGNKQTVSVLFSDIREFTTISESLQPEALVNSLNSYFTSMVDNILTHNGIIDKFIGDAIMALFGAPIVRKNDADNALYAALGMIKSLNEFNQHQIEHGKITFDIGIGINTGDVIVGNIGSEQKVDYTAIGDHVNLASRLEGLTKFYHVPVLISEFTLEALNDKDPYYFLNIDIVKVKGKQHPVKIYYPILRKNISSAAIQQYEAFHNSQLQYYQGNFEKALKEFQKNSLDNRYLIDMYIDRCIYLISNPPKNWDGVETWRTK